MMNNKNCVYILESQKDKGYYVGQTDNLLERLSAHNKGCVKSTKSRRPLEVIYFETFDCRIDAIKKESFIKSRKNTCKYLEETRVCLLNTALSSNG